MVLQVQLQLSLQVNMSWQLSCHDSSTCIQCYFRGFFVKMYCNKAISEAAAVLFTQECISQEDFLVLNKVTRRKPPEFPYWQYEHIDAQLQQMNNDECLAEFSVNLSELYVLAEVLRIPERFHCPNGTVASGLQVLCVVQKRFAYPC